MELYAPAALSQERTRVTHLIRVWVDPRAGLDRFEKDHHDVRLSIMIVKLFYSCFHGNILILHLQPRLPSTTFNVLCCGR
jgi:hypothetical protein